MEINYKERLVQFVSDCSQGEAKELLALMFKNAYDLSYYLDEEEILFLEEE